MTVALLEIGTEEIPARFIHDCLADLANGVRQQLTNARLMTADTRIESFGTYRRLALVIHDLPDAQPDADDTVDGPPLAIARSDSGEWLPPAMGFAKKCGVDVADLTESVNKKGVPILVSRRHRPGRPLCDVLADVYTTAVTAMRLPIAMMWGNGVGPFIRPVRWVCAMVNADVMPLSLFGVSATNVSYGHRFLTNGADASSGQPIVLSSPLEYVDALKDHHVWGDINERRSHIHDDIARVCGTVDTALLDEVVHLVECPTVLSVPFDADYLTLPKDVLITALRTHQKSFVVQESGAVLPRCMVVADSVTPQNQSTIIAGNQRVITARLSDARFFWEDDQACQGFSDWNHRLHNVVFQDGMGTMADKVERICHISHTIMDQLNVDDASRNTVVRAAHRCKADLVSKMVMEFPSLQGIMGGHYAQVFNEKESVCVAIRDHYKPRYDGDDMPETLEGAILSIADRVDTMVACFESASIPTGSRDPWGIRRSIIAIMRLMIHFRLPLNIHVLLEDATLTLDRTIGDTTRQCHDFFEKRVVGVLLDASIASDVIQMMQASLLTTPLKAYDQGMALTQLKATAIEDYRHVVDTAVRVMKLAGSFEGEGAVNTDRFEHDTEGVAWHDYETVSNQVTTLTHDSWPHIRRLCDTMSRYFDDVLVDAPDPDLATNRRAFVAMVSRYFLAWGDWLVLHKD